MLKTITLGILIPTIFAGSVAASAAVIEPAMLAKTAMGKAKAAGEWTLFTCDDGSMMWAYKGHPLYTFVDDKKPGEVTGDNKDGFYLAK